MAEMTYFDPDDLLGLSDVADIILVSNVGGARAQHVEVYAANGVYLEAGVVPIRPREEHTVEYQLIGGTIEIPIGEAVNTSYFITGVSCNCSAESYPRVSITFAKFTNANMFNTGSKKATITLTGGFGVVNLFGATAVGAISSSMSLGTGTVETLASTSGDLQEGGFALYGLKQTCSIESTTAISLPALGHSTAEDEKASSTGASTFSKSWFEYLYEPEVTPP